MGISMFFDITHTHSWGCQLNKVWWCFFEGIWVSPWECRLYGELVFLRGNWGFPVGMPTPYGELTFPLGNPNSLIETPTPQRERVFPRLGKDCVKKLKSP